MSATEIWSGTDIDYVRVLMGQAGRVHHVIENDEPTIAISTSKIYTEFKNVSDVVGIWDNLDHTGTNYATSGTFQAYEGQLNVIPATGVLTVGNEYFVSYVHADGLTDRQIQQSLDDAKSFIQLQLFTTDVDFEDVATDKGMMIRALLLNKASVNGVGILNMGNIIQSGFNYALGELRIETKLWGEGMSTEGLIAILDRKVMELMDYLKLFYTGSILYVSDRSYNNPSYDKQRWKSLTSAGMHGEWVSDGYIMSIQFRVVDPR
jgi:hypothetical protein